MNFPEEKRRQQCGCQELSLSARFRHCASYDLFRFASVGRVVSPRHGCRSRDANVGFFGSRMRKKSGVFVEPRSRATPATGRGGTSDGRPFRRDVMLKHNLRVPYKPSCGRMTSITCGLATVCVADHGAQKSLDQHTGPLFSSGDLGTISSPRTTKTTIHNHAGRRNGSSYCGLVGRAEPGQHISIH